MNRPKMMVRSGLIIAALAVVLGGSYQTPTRVNAAPATAPASQPARSVVAQASGPELIQALAAEDLIAGKDTVARDPSGGNITVKVDNVDCSKVFSGGKCSGSDGKDEAGASVLYLGKPTTSAGGKSYNISVNGKSFSRQVIVVQTKLKVFFLPVDWTAQMRSDPRVKYEQTITDMTRVSCDFMKAVYPVPPDDITCDKTLVPYMLRPFESTVADANAEINWGAITSMYASIGVTGRRYMPDATIVVGVMPPGWFGKHLKSANTLGLELHNVKGAVTSQVTVDFLNYQVAAHEIGHTFGLLDDYNHGIDPPRDGWVIDSDGFWLNKPTDVQTPHYYGVNDTDPQFGVGYISFMGAAGGPIWVDKCTFEYLRDAIKGGTPTTDCANSPGPDAKSQ